MSQNTPSTTLDKAIQQAVDAGWLPYFADFDPYMTKETIDWTITGGTSSVRFDVHAKGRIYGVSGYSMEIATLIFNHDFAKALWGEEPCEVNGDDRLFGQPLWKYHLQEMVIAPDPIEYLGANL